MRERERRTSPFLGMNQATWVDLKRCACIFRLILNIAFSPSLNDMKNVFKKIYVPFK